MLRILRRQLIFLRQQSVMKSRTAWWWLGLILGLLLGVLAYLGWKMYLSGNSAPQSVASQSA
jgi:predicted negative regulator of RcsB-dependent stress response